MTRVVSFILLVGCVVLGLSLGLWVYLKPASGNYVLSSGAEGGGYHTFAESYASYVGKNSKIDIEVIESEGSIQNARSTGDKKNYLGLVQLGVPDVDGLASIATVYHDVVHVLVRKGADFEGIGSLLDKRVSIGTSKSGTLFAAKQVFRHYGLETMPKQFEELEQDEAIALLKADKNSDARALDAVFLVTEMRAPVIQDALASGKVEHLEIVSDGGLDGLCSGEYWFESGVIAKHSYRKQGEMPTPLPEKAVEVLLVPSQLVCHEDLSLKEVYALTEALYRGKEKIELKVPAIKHLREGHFQEWRGYPLHPGAEEYYRRADPSFFVRYSDVIAMVFSVFAVLYGLTASVLKGISLKKKNRIDRYYGKVNEMLIEIENREVTDVKKFKKKIMTIRHEAFDELVKEKLPADASFVIFQSLLEQCVQALEKSEKESLKPEVY